MAKQKTPTIETVNIGAAAVDIGSREHMAAVNPDETDAPVRAFGTFTHDLHDLAYWLVQIARFDQRRDGIHGRVLDPCLKDTRTARLRGYSGQRSSRKERTRPEDRRQ